MVQRIIACFVVLLSLLVMLKPARTATADDALFECVVTEITDTTFVVTCDTRERSSECEGSNHPLCLHKTIDIPKAYWKTIPEWQYADGELLRPPRAQAEPVLGQVLKASWQGGKFVPLENCVVRTYKTIQEKGCSYCPPPIQPSIPEDCHLPSSQFVQQLVQRVRQRGL